MPLPNYCCYCFTDIVSGRLVVNSEVYCSWDCHRNKQRREELYATGTDPVRPCHISTLEGLGQGTEYLSVGRGETSEDQSSRRQAQSQTAEYPGDFGVYGDYSDKHYDRIHERQETTKNLLALPRPGYPGPGTWYTWRGRLRFVEKCEVRKPEARITPARKELPSGTDSGQSCVV